MDMRTIREIVDEAVAANWPMYHLAAVIAERQKEIDAQVCEAAGHDDCAAILRAGG